MRVLIVDDSEATRMLMERVLRLANPDLAQCFHASSGQHALDCLAASPVDIVFTDIHMEPMGGRDLIRAIRSNDSWKKVVIAVVTSERSKTTEADLLAIGADSYLVKPVRQQTISELFARMAGGRP